MSILSYSDHSASKFGHPFELFQVWIPEFPVTSHWTVGKLLSTSHLWNEDNNKFLENMSWGLNEMIEGKQLACHVTFQELLLLEEFLDVPGYRTKET